MSQLLTLCLRERCTPDATFTRSFASTSSLSCSFALTVLLEGCRIQRSLHRNSKGIAHLQNLIPLLPAWSWHCVRPVERGSTRCVMGWYIAHAARCLRLDLALCVIQVFTIVPCIFIVCIHIRNSTCRWCCPTRETQLPHPASASASEREKLTVNSFGLQDRTRCICQTGQIEQTFHLDGQCLHYFAS